MISTCQARRRSRARSTSRRCRPRAVRCVSAPRCRARPPISISTAAVRAPCEPPASNCATRADRNCPARATRPVTVHDSISADLSGASHPRARGLDPPSSGATRVAPRRSCATNDGRPRRGRHARLAHARVRPPDRGAAARHRADPRARGRRVRVRVQAIPFNLNDLERITGGNMMVRPELPYSPGMEVMGVVDACGAGAEEWQGQRVVAMPKGAHGGFAEYAICPAVSTFEMPDSIPLPDAAALYFPFHLAWLGLFDRAELQAGRDRADPRRGRRLRFGRGPARRATRARACSPPRAPTRRCSCAASSAPTSRSTTPRPTSPRSCSPRPSNAGVDVVFDNVGEAVMEASMKCTTYNGRYLMMGFASNKVVADEPFIVPRRDRARQHQAVRRAARVRRRPRCRSSSKTAMGWNFVPAELGAQIMREIVDLVRRREGETCRRPRHRLRRDPGRDRSDGEPRDRRPHRRRPRVVTEFSVSTWQQPMPPAPSPERAPVLDRLVEMIDALGDHRLRVAIDGFTAAGKTSLGHELARALSRRGRPGVAGITR